MEDKDNKRNVPADSQSGEKTNGTSAEVISDPSKYDILLGRGKPYQEHHGNIRLHQIVNLHRRDYLDAPRRIKASIVESIVRQIKTEGDEMGRFLKRIIRNEDPTEHWYEVSDLYAYKKVAHALRGKPRRVLVSTPTACGISTNLSSLSISSMARPEPTVSGGGRGISSATSRIDPYHLVTRSSLPSVSTPNQVGAPVIEGHPNSVRYIGSVTDTIASLSGRETISQTDATPIMWHFPHDMNHASIPFISQPLMGTITIPCYAIVMNSQVSNIHNDLQRPSTSNQILRQI